MAPRPLAPPAAGRLPRRQPERHGPAATVTAPRCRRADGRGPTTGLCAAAAAAASESARAPGVSDSPADSVTVTTDSEPRPPVVCGE
jgi:hypothetical protein